MKMKNAMIALHDKYSFILYFFTKVKIKLINFKNNNYFFHNSFSSPSLSM